MLRNPTTRRVVELLVFPLRFWLPVVGVLGVFFGAAAFEGHSLCMKYVRPTTVTLRDVKSSRSPLSQLPYRETEGGLERIFGNPLAPDELQVAVALSTGPAEGEPPPGERASYAWATEKSDEDKEKEEAERREMEARREEELAQKFRDVGGITDISVPPRRYSADLGSYPNEADAREYVRQLRERGHAAYLEVAGTGSGKTYIVRAGAFSSQSEADKLRKELEGEGFKPGASGLPHPPATSPPATPKPPDATAPPTGPRPEPTAPAPSGSVPDGGARPVTDI